MAATCRRIQSQISGCVESSVPGEIRDQAGEDGRLTSNCDAPYCEVQATEDLLPQGRIIVWGAV
jgi:hypothetical protein